MLFNLVQGCTPIHDAVIGATLGYLSLWLINAIYLSTRQQPGVGQGDFKLLAALGGLDWLGRTATAGEPCCGCGAMRYVGTRLVGPQDCLACAAALWQLAGSAGESQPSCDNIPRLAFWVIAPISEQHDEISSYFTFTPG